MSEENKNPPTQTPPPANTPPPPPPVDVEALVNAGIKNATAAIQKNVTSKIISSLGGEQEKTEHPIHTALVENPEGFVRALKASVKKEAMEEVTESFAIKDAAKEAFSAAVIEYPDLKKVKNEVLAEFQNIDSNLPISERMEKASKNIVERMGWKSKSQIENDESVKNASMSPGGYAPSAEAVSKLPTTGKDFIASKRAQFNKRFEGVKI